MSDKDMMWIDGMPSRPALEPQASPLPRVLIVDDDPHIRDLCTVMLTHSGYEVDGAADGAAGWAALQAKRYDLLITDNNMPKVSGVGLVRLLRQRDPSLPVIMASGATPTDEMKRHPQLAINVILLKPYTLEELLATVKQLLGATPHAARPFTPPTLDP